MVDDIDGGAESDTATCSCKVTRVATTYDIALDPTALTESWQDGTSTRELAREFNQAVVDARLSEVDASQTTWSRLPALEALQNDLSESEAIEVRREMERAGVDVDDLESDLLSHQTMYRHLTDCLDGRPADETTPSERRENARDIVYALQRRTTLVAESKIDTLQSADVTDISDPDVLVDIQVICRDCGYAMDFEDALTGGCQCE